MDSMKYIGMDVHKEAIAIAVLSFSGKLVMECVIETKAISVRIRARKMASRHASPLNINALKPRPRKSVAAY
jgi:hypothetical protein